MKKISALFVIILLAGCGQNYAPMQLGADPTAIPDMTLPFTGFTGTFSSATSFTGFNSTTQGFQWSQVISLNSTTVVAPVTGVVSQIETGQTNNTNNVTIYFNARYSIKITGITNLGSVRVGDYVTKGSSSIGLMTYTATLATIKVIVYQDGTPICPLTFFDSTSRAAISNTTLGYFTNNAACNG